MAEPKSRETDALNQHKAMAMGKSVDGQSMSGMKGNSGRPSAAKPSSGIEEKNK